MMKFRHSAFPFLTILMVIASTKAQRPFYLIGHMINSIGLVQTFLDLGSNVIESDVDFNRDGSVKELFHGYPCDYMRICDYRENVKDYMQHIKNITDPDKHDGYYGKMVMQFFDLKLTRSGNKMESGQDMARLILENLWERDGSKKREMKVLLYIEDDINSDFIKGFIQEFKTKRQEHRLKNIGFDGGIGNLEDIHAMFSHFDSTSNIWQGAGITNFFRPFLPNVRLRNALSIRDSPNGFIRKVYDWTVDEKPWMRKSLRLGVDGIITNNPEVLLEVLGEREFERKYSLATIEDCPFARYEGLKKNHFY